MRLILTALVLSTTAAAPALAAGCRQTLDPQMVRFVPKTPSSGPNPLFRLIGSRGAPTDPARRCDLPEQVVAGRR